MPDLPPFPHSDDTDANSPGRGPGTGAPRWVKVFAIVAGIAVVAFLAIHLLSGGVGGH